MARVVAAIAVPLVCGRGSRSRKWEVVGQVADTDASCQRAQLPAPVLVIRDEMPDLSHDPGRDSESIWSTEVVARSERHGLLGHNEIDIHGLQVREVHKQV